MYYYCHPKLYYFSRKDAYAFRFLYPGLITFLFFMVLPIIFTVYIGFTNLSTGHYLSQEQVKKALVEEKRLAPDSIIAGYRLYPVEKQVGKYLILVNIADNSYSTTIDLNSSKEEYTLSETKHYPETPPLTKGQIFNLIKNLKSFTFLHSTHHLKFFRTNKLASFEPTYTLDSKIRQSKSI